MPPTHPSDSIAIIGASLTGLLLTLSLLHHELFIPRDIVIYDLRQRSTPDPANSSGVVLTPNGLRILDDLGVLKRFAHLCWLSDYRTYKNDRGETIRKTLVANEELYGYKNHRVWRRILLETLLNMVEERGVIIHWQSRFEGVIDEGDTGVQFLVNGAEKTTGILAGSDGIYSTVRKYIDGDVQPEYTGIMGVLSHIRWDAVQWPSKDHERACTIQGKPGALVLMPEDREGSVVMVAMQAKMEEKSREQWLEMAGDTQVMSQFFRRGYEDWGPTAQGVIDAVCRSPDTMYLWPFMRMARLKRWSSEKGRVVILGDAAHALPPSSGQGVNQTLEDVYAFSRLLKDGPPDMKKSLEFWQQLRQERIDAVFDWATNVTNVQRAPQGVRDKLVQEGRAKDANKTEGFDDMTWLYQPNTDELIDSWLRTVGRK